MKRLLVLLESSILADICPLRFSGWILAYFERFSFTDSLVFRALQYCFGLAHSSGAAGALDQSQLVSFIRTESAYLVCLVLPGYFCVGRVGGRICWACLFIPLGGGQVNAGLWGAVPAGRSVWLLVPQL